MELLTATFYCIAGLFLLTWCGDKLVSGSVAIAENFKISRVFVGVVIMGFGTSLPEVLTAVSAMVQEKPLLALGNVIGSNIANIGVPLALSLILLKGKLDLSRNGTDFMLLIATYIIFSATFLVGIITPAIGAAYLVLLAAVLYIFLKMGQKAAVEYEAEVIKEEKETGHVKSHIAFFIIVGSLIGLVYGANILIDGATTIARSFGISERIIGLTLLAVGTSLPEVAASVSAARRGEGHVIMGNILGSNIFNIFGALGVGAFFNSISLASIGNDYMILLAFTALLTPLFYIKNVQHKYFGYTFITCYLIYIIYLGAY